MGTPAGINIHNFLDVRGKKRREVDLVALAKRLFIIDTGLEKVEVEGYEHRNVAIKYLMKRRRSLLSTKDLAKVESSFNSLPRFLKVIGKSVTRSYVVNWERVGTAEFSGSRFTFAIEEKK
jgi:hypothetical protein